MSQSVMATITALALQTNTSERKGNVVDNHEHIFNLDFFLFQPIVNCIATEIHICRWFEKEEDASFVADLTNRTVTPLLKRNIGRHSHGVQSVSYTHLRAHE